MDHPDRLRRDLPTVVRAPITAGVSRLAERRFRATVEQAGVGIAHASLDGQYLYVNRKFCEVVGYARDELIGRISIVWHPEDRAQEAQLRQRLLASAAQKFAQDQRCVRKGGDVVWVKRTLSLARDDAGRPLHFICVIEDIDGRKRKEARLQQFARWQQLGGECRKALAQKCDEAGLLDHLCRILVEMGGYRRARIGFAASGEPAEIRIAARAGWAGGASGARDPASAATDAMGDVIASGKRRLESGLAEERETLRRDRAHARGCAASLTLPLSGEGGCYGAVAIDASDAHAFDAEEISLLEELAEDIARGIAVRRAETARDLAAAAASQNEQRYQATFNMAAVGIAHVGVDGEYLQVNQAMCDLLGYTKEELLARTYMDVTHPDDLAGRGKFRAQLIANRHQATSSTKEKRYLRKDGSTLWASISGSLVRKPNGEPDYFVSMVLNVSERKAAEERSRAALAERGMAEQALRESEEHFRGIVNQAGVGITQVDLDGRFMLVNDKYCSIVGYGRDELAALRIQDIIDQPDQAAATAQRMRLLSGEIDSINADRRIRHKGGARVWVNVSTSLVRSACGAPKLYISVIKDISERKRAESALHESQEQFRQLAGNIPQMFWITSVSQRDVVYLSPAFEEITGRSVASAKASPRTLVEIVHPDDRRRVQTARKSAAGGGYDETFRLVRRGDRSVRWVRDRAFPIRDASGEVYRIAGIVEDITERKQAEERMLQLAHYDGLTNLPNRVLCYDRLQQALAQARRNAWGMAVMFVDLDRFKNINDTLGHSAGDALLQQASERLARCVRTGDTVGRSGGDEYMLVLSNLNGAEDAGVVAQKIMSAFELPFVLEGSPVYVTVSIGIALYPGDSKDQDELVRDADTAMYRAKELGRNNYQFYQTSMNAKALDKLNLENGLRCALENNEFRLHYQPKVSLASGEITGFEALLRWQHPERGLVSPVEFIPLLEETGLIVQAGEWVIRAASSQLKAWRDARITPKPIAVNLSARQFQSPALGPMITEVLRESGIEPGLLELEITESSLMHNTEEAVRTMEYLVSLGLRISIDDFGTGYSSLAYLKRFPLDALKIDRAFVKEIGLDSNDTAITLALISLAHNLGLKVIAEGVETEEQRAFLSANACDEMQGYYFARPLPVDECTEFLRQGKRLPRPALEQEAQQAAILLVDDDEDTLALIKHALRNDDYRILTASRAQAGLQLLAEHNIKVVVSDQQMPGMNGVEFLRRVKLLHPTTVRIMLTGDTGFETVSDAVNQGEIYRFLHKDWTREQLRKDIREACSAWSGARNPIGKSRPAVPFGPDANRIPVA